ncbi:Fungal Zn(2)-cys(6) binuclear cluster domain containing protein [Ceratobasidium theobromae]|uniref:Fungal Zn(2)-cys(6) binuclear cluster domain containing protein n=1 Tax=Ceratobasidium theobromae TaxID=1582974 RepID=A0A5N5QUY9_9AGAM|nr:Fungal Zn(2)-cys(6) binuclear cluster domain containing protein [Ceratobasidium theobromae]
MPTPPNASYPQDGHQIHSHLQPGTGQQGYYQHVPVLHKQPSHLMPPPASPLPLDPALVGPHQLQPSPHSPAQGQYGYSPVFGQPHQSAVPSRQSQAQFSMNQHFSQSQEPDGGSDDDDDEGESDDEPVATRGDKKRSKSNGGAASKRSKQSAANDDDDGNDSSTPAVTKPKATRGSKACLNCRRLKMKCVGAEQDLEGKCDRCRTNGHSCVFEKSNRGRNPTKKQENLMRQLKRMESTLDTLMHSISHPGLNSIPTGTVTRSPTPSSPSVSASNNARNLLGSPSASTPDIGSTSTSSFQKSRDKPRPSSPRLHMLPDNTLNPLGLLAEASLQNRRDKGASSGIGGMLPSNINEDDGSGKVDGRPVGVASDAYFKPGPMNILPLRRLYIERQVQPEMLSFVSTEEVVELFDIYFDHLNAQNGLLERGFHTPPMVCSRSPFLLTTVCAIAAKFYTKKPELHLKLAGIAKKLAFSVPERGYKSVEIVQAYLLLSLWGSGPVERYEQDKTWLLLGTSCLGIRVATDLNLHRKSTAQLDDSAESRARAREIRNRERTWLVCYILDRSLSAQMGKPHSVKEDFIIRNAAQWWKQPDSIPQDAGIVAYLEMQRILSRSLDFLYSGTQNASGLQTDCDYLLVIKTIESQLQAWSNEWEAHRKADTSVGADYRSSAAAFYYHYAMLVVNSFGLQNAMERSPVDISHFFSRCHTSAMSCALVVRDELIPRDYMRYSPDSHFVFTSYAVLTLLKLIRPEFSAFLDNEQKTLKLVQNIADLFEQIAANPYHTPALYSTFLRALITAKKESATAPSSPKPVNGQDPGTADEQVQQNHGPTISPDEPMGDTSVYTMGLRLYPPTGDGALFGEQAAGFDDSFPPPMGGHIGGDDATMNGLGMEHMFSNGFWDSMLMPGYGNQLGGLSGGFVYGFGGNSGFITPKIGSPFASGTGSPVRDAAHIDGINYPPYAPVFPETA